MSESEKYSTETLRKAVFSIVKATAITLPARFILYASALGGFFLMVGSLESQSLPPQIVAFLNMVGVNSFAHLLAQAATGDDDEKITAAIEDAIEKSNIENALTKTEFQRAVARMLRDQRHVRYAIESSRDDIAKLLLEQYQQYAILWEELHDDIKEELEEIKADTKKILLKVEDLSDKVAEEITKERSLSNLRNFDIHPLPARNQAFVGRQDIIDNILNQPTSVRFSVILGIPGIGKSELMRELLFRYAANGAHVFWFEFQAQLYSLDSILFQLAAFVDDFTDNQSNLSQKIQIPALSYDDRIHLIVKSLNRNICYIFFDGYEETKQDNAIENFFLSLKRRMESGVVFIASQIIPKFYTPVDLRIGTVKEFQLEGFTKSEVETFFANHNFSTASQLGDAFSSDVLPLSLVLTLGLLNEDSQETDLLRLIAQVEDDSIETLFDKVYEYLPLRERELLTTASCFALPFQEDQLLRMHQTISGIVENRQTLRKLKKRLLLEQFAPDYLTTHDIIRQMMLRYADDSISLFRQLADYLAQTASSSAHDALEAVLLYMRAKEYNSAADLIVELTDELILYLPDIAKTLLQGCQKLDVGTKQRMGLSYSQGKLHRHFRRFFEAEKSFSETLQLAGELKDVQAAAEGLLSLGNLYHDRDFSKAEKYYLQSLALLKSLNDIVGQAGIYNNLGSLYIGEERFDDAELMLNKGLKLLEDGNYPETDKLSLWGNWGNIYFEREQWDKAEEYTTLVRDVAHREELPAIESLAEYNLGLRQNQQGNYEKALEHYTIGLEISERYHLWSLSEQAHRAMGILYFTVADYEKAIQSFQALGAISEEIEDYGALAGINFDIGSFFIAKGDIDRAISYYEKGLALFDHLTEDDKIDTFLENTFKLAKSDEASARRIISTLKYLKTKLCSRPPSYALARVYGTLGHIYIAVLHKERVGFACLQEQVKLFDTLGLLRDKWGHQLNLVSRYQDVGRYADAIRVASEIIHHRQEEMEDICAMSYYERASAFVSLKQYEHAEGDFQNALALATKVENDGFLVDVQHDLGELYRRKNEPLKAIPLIRSSLEYAQHNQLTEEVIFTLNNLGLAYKAAEQYEEAQKCFEQSIQLARQHYRKYEEANSLISLGNVYSIQNNYSMAKAYYEQALTASRAIEDLNLIEGSVLSIAYTRWKMGIFEEFEPEFDKVAEQCADLKHYNNLFEFLKLAGQIYLARGDFRESADMFSQAIVVAYVLALEQYAQLAEIEESDLDNNDLVEMLEVLMMICDWVDATIHNYSLQEAKSFYQDFITRLGTELEGKLQWFLLYITPLGEFLEQLPHERAVAFVVSRWNFRDTEDEDTI